MLALRQTLIGIRLALPHAIRLVIAGLGRGFWLVAIAVIGLVRGLNRTGEEIAEHWLADALANGFPFGWEVQLRASFQVLAGLSLAAGLTIIFFAEYFTVNWAVNLLSQP